MRLLLIACVVSLFGCANSDKAEDLAREFATLNYPGHTIVNVKCQDADSDQDGYVSCNLSMRTPEGSIVMPPIECSGGWVQVFHDGCRFPKAHGVRPW